MLPLFTATPRTDPYGTALICDVLTAYRRDLERTPDIVHFGDADAQWLTAGLDVERLTASPALGDGAAVVAKRRALRPRPLLALTAIFDNVLVGTGIVGYDLTLISGARIGVAPLEDFAYAIAALVLLPSLWSLLGGVVSTRPQSGLLNPRVSTRAARYSTSGSDESPT